MARIGQTDGGHTDVSMQNRPSINNVAAGGGNCVAHNIGNIDDGGDASLRPRAVTPEFGSLEFVCVTDNCSFFLGVGRRPIASFMSVGVIGCMRVLVFMWLIGSVLGRLGSLRFRNVIYARETGGH